jgi:flagellar hook protein FlgE
MAGEAGFGSIQGSSIESSNVDLTVEMVLLIAAQRAFQSAAEVVKKQDETVQTINRISG